MIYIDTVTLSSLRLKTRQKNMANRLINLKYSVMKCLQVQLAHHYKLRKTPRAQFTPVNGDRHFLESHRKQVVRTSLPHECCQELKHNLFNKVFQLYIYQSKFGESFVRAKNLKMPLY